VRDWTHNRGNFRNVSFEGRPGEIVALMGVEGSGARELLRSLGGLEKCSGEIEIGALEGAAALKQATAYVPATRQLSLYSNFTVGENLLVRLGYPDIAGPGFALRTRQMKALAENAVRRFLVKARSTMQPIRSLSGGNQQKVAIAQALTCAPKLLLLEEPTRGVDIQSKGEIYRLLREYAAAGNAVLIFCTEVLEIFEAADQVHVVSAGRLSAALPVAGYTHVEQLATDITRLENEHRNAASAAARSGAGTDF
jgi:ABC-type sugar transport system ATPase subunit